MSTIDQKNFDDRAESWAHGRKAPWNLMRYEITHDFISAVAPKRIKRVLNIGCADGFESFLYRDAGVHHTLSDCSAGMLAKARELADRMAVAGSVEYIHAGVHSLGAHLDGQYDLILFHNVIEYITEPLHALQGIRDWLAPGGLLSLRHLNRYSNVYVPAMYDNNLALAAKYLHQPQFESSFSAEIQTYTGEEILEMLRTAGFGHATRYGVMSICGFIPDNEVKKDEEFYRSLKALEMSMAQRFPYYHIARFGLFLATEDAPTGNGDGRTHKCEADEDTGSEQPA